MLKKKNAPKKSVINLQGQSKKKIYLRQNYYMSVKIEILHHNQTQNTESARVVLLGNDNLFLFSQQRTFHSIYSKMLPQNF